MIKKSMAYLGGMLLLLSHSGCEQVQGFYFAKPMRELDFDRLLNQQKKTKER